MSCSFLSGNFALRYAMGLTSMSSWSTKCCEKNPMRSLRARSMVPTVGSRCPAMSLSSVDLPVPLGPTSAMRDVIEIPKLTRSKRRSRPGYANDMFVTAMSGAGSSVGSSKWSLMVCG
eukprot:Amastigsp_a842133_121.p4 type:complete len:118 gc:universal Amastigsp_a842133_121:1298-945(-)